jgi:nucleotide-binding universal stress UspA family protein
MNIVVGYIPRKEGLAAVEYATELAVRESASVTIVNSGVLGNDSDPSFAPASDLDAISARLDQRGVDHEIRQPVAADLPAEEILKAAADVNADLIVIGLRRRPLVGKIFLGSTVQHIIIEAECPVITVKQRSV